MLGGFLGAIVIVDKSERLYEWILMYDETQPFA
jgi:hypothetical protein